MKNQRTKLLENADSIFESKSKKAAPTRAEITAPLHEEIGQLKMDMKWLKKSFSPAR